MNANISSPPKPVNQFRILAGLIITASGVVMIIRNLNIAYVPDWLFDWYTIFIIVGLYMSARSDLKNFMGLIFVFVGVMGMLSGALPGLNVWGLMWPLALIGTGAWFLLKNRNAGVISNEQPEINTQAFNKQKDIPENDSSSYTTTGDEYLDNVTVLHNLKRTIISKDFRGGDIVSFLGSTKLNFTQADIQDVVVVDITQTLSNTKITVPAGWRVVNDVDAILSEFDDKRLAKFGHTPGKVLVLKGTSVLSKLELKSDGFNAYSS